MLIQIHILQNYAPSNLNRDDTGSPKDAVFGGYRRGRISSQCLKRSIRRSIVFEEAFKADGLLGTRTKQLPRLIGEQLAVLGADEGAQRDILARLPEIGRESAKGRAGEVEEGEEESQTGEVEEREAQTAQLIFIGAGELRPMAERLLAVHKDQGPKGWKKLPIDKIAAQLGPSIPRSVDIAMFGRMTTSEAFENVEAAVQVAHALSTNALNSEFDYYTAVDDLSGESGAGMIGDVEFNSSTYYKYFNVHWEQLLKNLGGDLAVARRAASALLEAAALAQPSGKQNSFAAHNLPDFILVELHERNVPVSYANAFLHPARAGDGGSLMDASVEALWGYTARLAMAYDLHPGSAVLATRDAYIPSGREGAASLSQLKKWLEAQLPE